MTTKRNAEIAEQIERPHSAIFLEIVSRL